MAVYPIRATFARGELSPRLHARSDLEHYSQALATERNWQVMRQGGAKRRAGSKYINRVHDEGSYGRLVRFEFSERQAYALLFNGGQILFFTLGGIITNVTQSITAITKANPAVATYSGADNFSNGDNVIISGVVGMTEVNNREFKVANVNTTANTFELKDANTVTNVDSSGYGTYVSGGTISHVYAVVHPYSTADLPDLQFAQAGDTIYIAHPSYAPRKLVRSSETSWALSVVSFDDGPWLDEDEQGTYFTPAANGAVSILMASNSTSSYAIANSDTDTDAWLAFDRDVTTGTGITGTSGWLSVDFPSTTTKVADAYWIAAGNIHPENTPSNWTFEGWNGAAWVVLDTRIGETSWSGGERRYYDFPNKTGYLSYRIKWTSIDGGSDTSIEELIIHESGDTQTAFNLTASATTGINGGTGFVSTDVGRTIRLMGADGIWRWARIAAYTSSTVVTIRLYGHALLDLSPIVRWQLSSWSASDGYPAAVGFFDDRLGWACSTSEPRRLWLSRSSDYEDHGISVPPEDDDGINANMNGGQIGSIAFIQELDDLAVGTPSAIRIVDQTDPSQALSSTNIRQKARSREGATTLQPVVVGSNMIYPDRYATHLFEFSYSNEGGGYGSRELSILSEHLVAAGITELSVQQTDERIIVATMADGTLTTVTYDLAQQIAGFTPLAIAGGGSAEAVVESACTIPSATGDVLYAVVKRTINGSTHRYVEYLTPSYVTGNSVADMLYFDSGFIYSGSAVSTVTGLNWLIGETIGLLADGVDIGDATVNSHGTVTLPNSKTGSKINGGKRYTSSGISLRAPGHGNQDGTGFGRRRAVSAVGIDMLNTAGLKVGTLQGTRWANGSPISFDTLFTGIKPILPIADRTANDGVTVFSSDRGYPAMVRALVIGLDGEP